MNKEHFVYGANKVIQECKDNNLNTFLESNSYWIYVDLFEEFGKKFDKEFFDDYINKRIYE